MQSPKINFYKMATGQGKIYHNRLPSNCLPSGDVAVNVQRQFCL